MRRTDTCYAWWHGSHARLPSGARSGQSWCALLCRLHSPAPNSRLAASARGGALLLQGAWSCGTWEHSFDAV